MYSQKVMEHFLQPHNMGQLKNPDAVGQAGNVVCGDVMQIYLKVKSNVIKEIKFQTLGCAAAISTSSIVTDLAKGKTLDKALKIAEEDILKELGGLPPVKVHCSLLAVKALKSAIYDYLVKNELPVPPELRREHQEIEREVRLAEGRHDEMRPDKRRHEHDHGKNHH